MTDTLDDTTRLVAETLQRLHDQGSTWTAIANATGCDRFHLSQIAKGNAGPVGPRVAERVLGLEGVPVPVKQRTTDRVHDLLSIDGGWWDAHHIADRLDASYDKVHRTLLRHQGLLFEQRPNPNDPTELRKQWRAL